MGINWNEIVDEIRDGAKDERCIKLSEQVCDIRIRTYWVTQHLVTYCRSDDLQHLLDVEEGLMDLITSANKALACCKKEISVSQEHELPTSAGAPVGDNT